MFRLLYAPTRDNLDDAVVVYECSEAVPVGWLLLFGGRNFGDPDEKVSDRGGTSATRDRWITPLGVAEARLGSALEAFSESEHLAPWFSPLRVMHRKVLTYAKSGFFHLQAPAFSKDPKKAEAMAQTPAIMENVANSLIAERYNQITAQLKAVEPFVLFIPHFTAKDQARFMAEVKKRKTDPVRLVADFCLGQPNENHERFYSIIEKDCAALVETINNLPPYPSIKAESLPKSAPAPKAEQKESKSSPKNPPPPIPPAPEKKEEEKPAGFFAKLLRLFKRN